MKATRAPALLVLAFVALLCISSSGAAFFFLAPLLCAFGPLLAGRFPAERMLWRLITVRLARPLFKRVGSRRSVHLFVPPRSGGILAFALAGRGPPIGPGVAA
jgi:hypothetical protein